LADNIEDNPGNRTWFAVIGDHTGRRTGHDHTAIMFQTQHRFGALVDALAVFKRNRINLTWIESFPVPGSERVYLFFVELEGHEQDARFGRAVAALKRRTLRMEVLGSYPVDTPIR
jgi:chorismate mutase/prephenate dehydratase